MNPTADKDQQHAMSHISVAFEFDGSIQRKERFAYPLPAVREVLLNAIVHRSYTDPNDIQIKIFDDKITIFSPGTFYGGLTVAEIQTDNYRSSLRNKLVAEGFYLINVIEKYGSGFIRIRRALKDYPEVQFDVQEFQGGVMATFTLKQPAVPTGQVTGQVTPEIMRLLGSIRGEMSRQQLQQALALTSRNNFDNRYLKPAVQLQWIEPTLPDKPTSRLQKYRLTASGQALVNNQQVRSE